MNKFYTQWRICIRKLMSISPRTHGGFLPLIINDLPIEYQMFKRFLKFMYNVLNILNKCISLCGKLALSGSNSSSSKNLNLISERLKCSKYILSNNDALTIINAHINTFVSSKYTDDDLYTVGNIADLLFMRDTNCTQFSTDEINTMLKFICTT